MPIALIISGLPRYVKTCFPNINECLIKPNNPDVFIHTWNDLDGTLNYPIAELYKPVAMKAENQKKWSNSKMNLDRMMAGHARSYARDKFVEMLYSSWYSTQQANLLKEQHRLHHDLKYDYVIRARFDLYFSRAVRCADYDPNIINLSNKWLPDTEMADDGFAFASDALMSTYCGGFNMLEHVQNLRHQKDGVFCGETLVYEICRMANIKHAKITNLTCDNVSHLVANGTVVSVD